MKPSFYGLYRVVKRVGEVAYELELPEESKIHNVFHGSCLKRALGQQVIASAELPMLDEERQLVLDPEEILEVKERRLRSRVIKEYLIKQRLTYGGCYLGWRAYLNILVCNCLRTSNLRKAGL